MELAKKLGTERPVYGLQAVSEGDASQPTLEDLAAQYLASKRKVQAEGLPGCWSNGAVIAYEMAGRPRASDARGAVQLSDAERDAAEVGTGEGQLLQGGLDLLERRTACVSWEWDPGPGWGSGSSGRRR